MKRVPHSRRLCGMILGLDSMTLVRIAFFTACGLLYFHYILQ